MTAIVIAAGGTAGHVMPALAVAEELVLRGATVSFAGTPGRVKSDTRLAGPTGGFVHLTDRSTSRKPVNFEEGSLCPLS